MKIISINKTNFSGKFNNNTIFKRVLENSFEPELKDFLDILNRMQKKDDGRVYSLRIVSEPLLGGDFLMLFENETMRGHRVLQYWDNKSKKISPSVLRNINVILMRDYPPPKEELPPKEILLKEIHKILDVNI